MTMPGDRLLALATWVCSARAIERVLGPAIADLRWEYREAQHHHRTWRARWIRATGSLTVLYLIIGQTCFGGQGSLAASPTTGSSLARVIAGSVALVVVMTVALVAIVMSNTPFPVAGNLTPLVFYLLPATLPVTVPCGFGLAISQTSLGRSRQRAHGAFIIATALSLLTFATVGWIMPASNQAYRNTAAGRDVMRGFNELTFPEIRAELAAEPERLSIWATRDVADPGFTVREAEYSYQSRLAISVAPIVVALFAFSLSLRRRILRRVGMLAMLAIYLGWYVGMRSPVETFSGLSPTLVAWLPNVALLVAAACAFGLRPTAVGP
jgi:hypothetical protein